MARPYSLWLQYLCWWGAAPRAPTPRGRARPVAGCPRRSRHRRRHGHPRRPGRQRRRAHPDTRHRPVPAHRAVTRQVSAEGRPDRIRGHIVRGLCCTAARGGSRRHRRIDGGHCPGGHRGDRRPPLQDPARGGAGGRPGVGRSAQGTRRDGVDPREWLLLLRDGGHRADARPGWAQGVVRGAEPQPVLSAGAPSRWRWAVWSSPWTGSRSGR